MAPLATNQPSQPDHEQAAFTVLNHEEPAPAPPPARPRHVLAVRPLQRDPPPPPAPGPEFSRALDRKLRRLQAASRPPRNKDAEERPRFVTTVKSGQFLLPPPELAALLGLQSLYPSPQSQPQPVVYSYASRPQAVAPRVHTRRKRDASGASVADGKEGEVRGAGGGGCSKLGTAFGAVRALAAAAAGFQRAAADKINGQTPSGVTHDKRIVRGSTIASHTLAAGDGPESAAARAARTRRRALARRAAAARCRPGTPPPAPGRRHHPIQTEQYLEELYCAGAEIEAGTQTDLFVDRPASPVYVPAKTGADAATQIYPGELFDFDLEVQPILEVLVGKTAEQALAEVSQEEELATLREQQRRYMELRDGERAERERLAAHHARLQGEKQRRGAEARQAQAAAIEARERAAAAVLVQGYVAELLPSVLAGLREQGYLRARVERGVGEELLPWLLGAVSTEMEGILTSRDVITEIVRDVVEARAELYRAAGEREGERPQPEDSNSESEELDEQQGEEDVRHKRSASDGSHNHLVDN